MAENIRFNNQPADICKRKRNCKNTDKKIIAADQWNSVLMVCTHLCPYCFKVMAILRFGCRKTDTLLEKKN